MTRSRVFGLSILFIIVASFIGPNVFAQGTSPLDDAPAPPKVDVKARYEKRETMIPMRDGKKLFTAIYAPKEKSKKYPILMIRTPYSCAPYGLDQFKEPLHPNGWLLDDGYVFVIKQIGVWEHHFFYTCPRRI